MALTIGDTAPDFEADTTQGRISFHDWIGDSWAVLFSHPKDYTPVCTTELGYMAKIKPEFDRRNVKVIGLSVDSTGDHEGWVKDIEETQGAAPNYPIIGDADFEVSKAYGMLPAEVGGEAADRTAADNQTVRNVFVVGPDKKVKLTAAQLDQEQDYIRRRIKAEVASNLFGLVARYRIDAEGDGQLQKALDLFPQARKMLAAEVPGGQKKKI